MRLTYGEMVDMVRYVKEEEPPLFLLKSHHFLVHNRYPFHRTYFFLFTNRHKKLSFLFSEKNFLNLILCMCQD